MQAAHRELFEESGATEYTLMPLCDYWAGSEDGLRGESGVVFTANIRKLGDLPESEMAEVQCFDVIPDNLTYPPITKEILRYMEDAPTRILIGTTNPSKVKLFADMLSGTHTQLFTLADLEIRGEPEETGSTLAENAEIKAAYYARYADNVICMDSGLYLDALPLEDARQPGLHVRTPNGCARLDDEQMIAYYSALAHELGDVHWHIIWMPQPSRRAEKRLFWRRRARKPRKKPFISPIRQTLDAASDGPLDSLSLRLDGTHFLDEAKEADSPQENPYAARVKATLRERFGQ